MGFLRPRYATYCKSPTPSAARVVQSHTGTRSGNTTVYGTTSGTLTNGDCVSINNGNLVDAGGACTRWRRRGNGFGWVEPDNSPPIRAAGPRSPAYQSHAGRGFDNSIHLRTDAGLLGFVGDGSTPNDTMAWNNFVAELRYSREVYCIWSPELSCLPRRPQRIFHSRMPWQPLRSLAKDLTSRFFKFTQRIFVNGNFSCADLPIFKQFPSSRLHSADDECRCWGRNRYCRSWKGLL